jgi:DNA-binding response OmpR family regulator
MAGPAPKRILIVEDERDFQDMLKQVLEAAGYRVWAAGNGETGLALYREAAPDAVILDVHLPDMSGFDICRSIRVQGPRPETPVLICTIRSEVSGVAEGLGCGATDYVVKPFEVHDLLERLDRALQAHDSRSR